MPGDGVSIILGPMFSCVLAVGCGCMLSGLLLSLGELDFV
jgi:hypothetical protein